MFRIQRLLQIQQGTHSSLLIKGLPYGNNKYKVVNIQRSKRLKYKEIKPACRLPIVHTHRPYVVRVYKPTIK